MSSTRRTASETNILAMLDRHESRGPGRRLLRGLRGMPAMAWYGTAGVLVIGLVGSLAWLARDSGSPSPADSALASPAVPGAPPVAASPPLSSPAMVSADATAEVVSEADAGLVASTPAAGATIVDLAPDAPTPPPEAPPALRVLPPQEHAGRILPRDGRRLSQDNRQDDQQHGAQRVAAATKSPRTAGSKPAATAHAQAHLDARARRPAAAPKQAPAAVDTDVALITAIIQHASKRQDAEEETREVRKP
jgi:hypothetical protein